MQLFPNRKGKRDFMRLFKGKRQRINPNNHKGLWRYQNIYAPEDLTKDENGKTVVRKGAIPARTIKHRL